MQRIEWLCHTKSVSGALYKAILYHGQSAGKERANSAVFNFQRNAGSDWISLTEVGREFQVRDAAAGTAIALCTGVSRMPSSVRRLWRCVGRPLSRVCKLQAGRSLCRVVFLRLLCRRSFQSVCGLRSPVQQVSRSDRGSVHFVSLCEAVPQPRRPQSRFTGNHCLFVVLFFWLFWPSGNGVSHISNAELRSNLVSPGIDERLRSRPAAAAFCERCISDGL